MYGSLIAVGAFVIVVGLLIGVILGYALCKIFYKLPFDKTYKDIVVSWEPTDG